MPTLPAALLTTLGAISLAIQGCGDDGRGLVGAACERDADCGATRLVCGLAAKADTTGVTPAPLTCLPIRDAADGPGAACQGPADCDHGLCAVSGACVLPCRTDEDCGESERCQPLFASDGGGVSAMSLRACQRHTALPPGIEAMRTHLPNAVDEMGGALPLPAVAAPTLFVVSHDNDDRWPASERCRPPLCPLQLQVGDASSGEVLFDADALGATPPRLPIANPSSSFPFTVYFGSQPSPPYRRSGYTLDVTSEVAGDVTLTSISGSPRGSRLDLNLFYVGGGGFRPEGARGPEVVMAALEEVERILAPVDIALGDIRQRAVPEALIARGNTFDSPDSPGAGFDPIVQRFGVWAELPALFALSAGADNPAVNVFLVSRIDGTSAGAVRGLSGGTPGPWGMHGTGASGIAIGVDDLASNPTALGRNIAHELCHFLGLFHTSERNGQVLDPLPDTAACTLAQDTDDDGNLSAADCAEHGADNLMFWAETAGTTLTPDQIRVLRRAMLLR